MSDESLTYRASGVDVEANLEANRRIQAYVRRTYTDRVLTRGGLFGGALRLSGLPEPLERLQLTATMLAPPGDRPEQVGLQIARSCRSRLAAGTQPLAFLDYLAAAQLDARRAADLVGQFSQAFAADPKIPIIGGETAEMPDVFREGGWEVVGALFAAGSEQGGADGRIDLGTLRGYAQPALVFSMDGVGTKTKIGVQTRQSSGLAADIIHHSLDDILCQGARGMGFVLYLGCHGRDEQLIGPLLAAARACCRSNGVVLLDSEVSEKPDLYRPGEIDLCGAIVGVVEADRLIQGEQIRAGDVLLGLTSSGLHTNGYSLARKALLERGGLALEQQVPELGSTLGQALLEPHRNYAPLILPLLEDGELRGAIRGIAHITGGGLEDNLERILPPAVRAEIRLDSWQPPPIFQLIRRSGNIPFQDSVGKGMYESFNMGIGLVLAVAPEQAERVLGRIREGGQDAVAIGAVLDSDEGARRGGVEGAGADSRDRRCGEVHPRVRLL